MCWVPRALEGVCGRCQAFWGSAAQGALQSIHLAVAGSSLVWRLQEMTEVGLSKQVVGGRSSPGLWLCGGARAQQDHEASQH